MLPARCLHIASGIARGFIGLQPVTAIPLFTQNENEAILTYNYNEKAILLIKHFFLYFQ
jgi:hypothetical protein